MPEEEPIKKERKPFVPSAKWLAAQEMLKEKRKNDPDYFKNKNPKPKKRAGRPPTVSRAEFSDTMAGEIQQMMNMATGKLKLQLENANEKGNPVQMSLVLKNLNDINAANQGSVGLSRAKDSKNLMKLEGKDLSNDALIKLSRSANITDLSDIDRLIKDDKPE